MRDESRFFVWKFTLLDLESGSARRIKQVPAGVAFSN
jgi:hypothetical protein